jgi:hypothetical protein
MGQCHAKARIEKADAVIDHDQWKDDGDGRQEPLQQNHARQCGAAPELKTRNCMGHGQRCNEDDSGGEQGDDDGVDQALARVKDRALNAEDGEGEIAEGWCVIEGEDAMQIEQCISGRETAAISRRGEARDLLIVSLF